MQAFPHDADYANPIQRYRKPLTKRLFSWLIDYGWAVVFGLVLVLSGSGCTDDPDRLLATAASITDAQQQARADQRFEAALVAMRGE